MSPRWIRRRLDHVRRAGCPAERGDCGSALVEFVSIGALMLVPLVYLILTLGRLQAATFAAEGAARESGRLFVTAPDEETGAQRAQAAVLVAVRDQGFDLDPVLTVECEETPCLQPQARVVTEVELEVVLPVVPRFVDRVIPTRVTVRASHLSVVDGFSR